MSADKSIFSNVKDEKLRAIIFQALQDMSVLLEQTPCIGAVSIADQLNDIKKNAFEEMYAIGRQAMDVDSSENVLKAIRALQDAFGQIIVAISPMDNVAHSIKKIWLNELEGKNTPSTEE